MNGWIGTLLSMFRNFVFRLVTRHLMGGSHRHHGVFSFSPGRLVRTPQITLLVFTVNGVGK